ncbi:PH domain-containing protein [Nocardiopsis sp. CNT-189]|uniref:PH domain-containing protein n=1 Tax=Nocardiopsis oceanisediminis TaxID=2816862 RepID=UPI003B2A2D66
MTTREAARHVAEPRLRPPRHRVQRRAIAHWTVRTLFATAAAAAPTAIAAVTLALFEVVPWLVLTLGAATAAVAAIGLAVTAVMPVWRYRVHRWEITDEAVYTASGWLWQEWRIAPLSRIQTVDTDRGPLQRAFGLATLTVTTASAAGPLKVDGLDAELAADLAARLSEATQAIPGDAT